MPSYELTKSDIAALGIPEKIKNKEILTSLAEIAAYLEMSITSVRKLIKLRGLPAMTIPDGPYREKYRTTKSLIDSWIREQHLQRVERYGWLDD